MSNIQKAFKNKAKLGLRMAVGGFIGTDPMNPQGFGRPMDAQVRPRSLGQVFDNKIAMGDAMSSLSNTERQQFENPTNQKYGMRSGPAPGSAWQASIDNRQNDIMRTLRGTLNDQQPTLAAADSAVVQGEGTRTSDSVPASVGQGADKQKLALSKGEGLLVVSNNTMDNPEALGQIEQILTESNGGKAPVMPNQGLRGGVQKAAASAVIPGLQLPDSLDLSKGAVPPAPAAIKPAIPPRVDTAAFDAEVRARAADARAPTAAAPTPTAPTAPAAAPAAAKAPWYKPAGVLSAPGEKALSLSGEGLRGRAKAAAPVLKGVGGVGAAASSGFQGYNTGSDLREVWGNDNADIPTKLAATLQGAGDVAGNVLSLGMLQSPISAAADFITGGDTAMSRGLRGTSRAPTPVAAAAGPTPKAVSAPAVNAPAAQPTPEQAAQLQASEAASNGASARYLSGEGQRRAGLRGGTDANSNARMMSKAVTGDEGTRAILNAGHAMQGDGITYGTTTGANGKPQVQLSGGAPTKMQYVAADGTPTNEWNKTSAYAEATKQNEKDQVTLRTMQHDRIARDAASVNATEGDRVALAAQLKGDEINGTNATKMAAVQQQALEFQRSLRNDARAQSNHEQGVVAAEEKDHQKNVDELLKSSATVDWKLDAQKYAQLQKYASQSPRRGGMSASRHLRELVDNLAIDNMGDEAGRHWLTKEGTWAGEKTKWQKRSAGAFDRTLRGAPLQSVEYHDPLTGRTIYQSDVDKLSPNQRALFDSRIIK